jgi:hypothetical protein
MRSMAGGGRSCVAWGVPGRAGWCEVAGRDDGSRSWSSVSTAFRGAKRDDGRFPLRGCEVMKTRSVSEDPAFHAGHVFPGIHVRSIAHASSFQ